MKILFIVGSLEEEKNGVADYTIILCKSFIKLGHEVAIISINDSHYVNSRLGSVHNSTTFLKLRLTNKMSNLEKSEMLGRLINDFKPIWISIQFVSFAFQNKGLPFQLPKILKSIQGFPLHIMFHELWVDYKNSKNFKKWVLGNIQKGCINYLIDKLKPILITTSINYYRDLLLPKQSNILPLFGNIEPLKTKYIPKNNKELNVVFFGSFSPHLTDFILQLKWIKSFADKNYLNLRFHVIGNNGIYKENSIAQVKLILGRYALNYIGQCKSNQVSKYLNMANFGVSRADFNFFGKSGSTMAMLEHGLPVLLRGNEPTEVIKVSESSVFLGQLFYKNTPFSQIPEKQSMNEQQLKVANKLLSLFKISLPF